ncbi:2383_t:CDS:1, partial [Rhizophagus irregularis]
QDYGNGEEFISSSVHDKSHIFHPEREHQELLFDITSWRDGKYCTKEERKLKYQIIKRAANRRDKMMRTLFLNVKTKEKMEDCANSWGHCAEVVPLREENS